jgi:hypothetical protein
MALLKPAVVEQSAAKVGVFGRQGSGKTTTAALIAIGLSKTYHKNAPVAFLDTENGSDYLVPIFEAEGVQLLVVKSRSFKDMRGALTEAEQAGCCAYLVDSYTHPWQELTQTFKEKSKRKKLEFHHMDALKTLWRGWTDQFLNSPLHCIVSGRLGFEWGEGEDGDGDSKLIKLGTKMKGETEAGYEPSLLIEMEAVQESDARLKANRQKRGTIVHHCYVLKDRWRALNGRTFAFKDINQYKPGDYKKVYDAFAPHWSKLAIGTTQRAVDPSRTSETMLGSDGETEFQRRAKRVQIALEEVKEIASSIWPGQDAASKKARQHVLEGLFGTLSWTAVEGKPLGELEDAVVVLQQIREAARDTNAAITDPAWITGEIVAGRAWVEDAKRTVDEAAF